jgi:hypothetical protein
MDSEGRSSFRNMLWSTLWGVVGDTIEATDMPLEVGEMRE